MSVILDDSPSVWAQHIGNLLEVERYVYFPSSRQQLRRQAPSLLEVDMWGPLIPLRPFVIMAIGCNLHCSPVILL